jgi:1-acyl-sn-glycerol-3-phosphate acyltransferase
MTDAPASDSGRDDLETGATVDFSAAGGERPVPARLEDLRSQLPGLEPERRVTDWGRSERVEGMVDRMLYDFLYHYWFRVEVEGIENVPTEGGGLLVANHSGAVPADAVMIAKAIREEHPRRRIVQLTTDGSLANIPAVGMMVSKLGGVANHPANLHRLLYDEQQLVLSFPEGRRAAGKPMERRYRLAPFARGGSIGTAFRAHVPIVPIAVLGAEEASPVLARLGPGRWLRRLPALPLTSPFALPAKFRIRFLEPVGILDDEEVEDERLALGLTEDIRALIQENLLEMVGARRSVWLG